MAEIGREIEERVTVSREVREEEVVEIEELKEGAPGIAFACTTPALPIRLAALKRGGDYEVIVEDVSSKESQKVATVTESEIRSAFMTAGGSLGPGPRPLAGLQFHIHRGPQCPGPIGGRCTRDNCGGRRHIICRRTFLWYYFCIDWV